MTKDYVIWWTNQTDCQLVQAIFEAEQDGGAQFEARAVPSDWPNWLREQWESRWGRNGRGRLWNEWRGTALPGGVPWPDDALTKLIGGQDDIGRHSAAGIVVPIEDLHHVIGLPGFVTTDQLARLCVNGVDMDL